MSIIGKCKLLRVYLDEDLKWHNQLLYKAIMDKLLKAKIAGATVFKGVEGYGSKYQLHTPRIIELTEKLPVLIEIIDTSEQALRALNLIEEMLPTNCLVTVQDIEVLHNYTPDGNHAKTEKW